MFSAGIGERAGIGQWEGDTNKLSRIKIGMIQGRCFERFTAINKISAALSPDRSLDVACIPFIPGTNSVKLQGIGIDVLPNVLPKEHTKHANAQNKGFLFRDEENVKRNPIQRLQPT